MEFAADASSVCRPLTIDYVIACDTPLYDNLTFDRRSVQCRIIPDAATLISVAEKQSAGAAKVTHQEQDRHAVPPSPFFNPPTSPPGFCSASNNTQLVLPRVKLAVMCRFRWQELYRAGYFRHPEGERGVYGVQVAGPIVTVYWCGFLPLLQQPTGSTSAAALAPVPVAVPSVVPAAAADADVTAGAAPVNDMEVQDAEPAGHFCALELCQCDLSTGEGVMLCLRVLYLISTIGVLTSRTAGAGAVSPDQPRTRDSLTLLLDKFFAAASVPDHSTSSSDEPGVTAVCPALPRDEPSEAHSL